MKATEARRAINGKYGEVWIDDQYMAEVTGLEAKVTLKKEEVKQVMKNNGYKVMGIEGKGTLKLTHVSSFFISRLTDSMKSGKMPTATIISKLEDPDAFGCERVKFTGVVFDELTLADWEVDKLGEESIPFTFEDWELLDVIKYQ